MMDAPFAVLLPDDLTRDQLVLSGCRYLQTAKRLDTVREAQYRRKSVFCPGRVSSGSPVLFKIDSHPYRSTAGPRTLAMRN